MIWGQCNPNTYSDIIGYYLKITEIVDMDQEAEWSDLNNIESWAAETGVYRKGFRSFGSDGTDTLVY